MGNKSSSSRRSFLAGAGKAAAAAAVAGSAPTVLRSQTSDAPPNVVFIICDQMRGDALSFLGNPNSRTPHLARMAQDGVTCESGFAQGPVCVPSRKSNFSGLYPHQHGSLTNRERPLLSWAGSMLDSFQRRGYRTGWVGKNHTFEKGELAQLDTASIRDREPFRAYNGFVPPHWHTDVYWPEEHCYPRVNTEATLQFIRAANRRDPFFLHISYFDPHPPYMAPAAYTSRYHSSDMQLPPYIPPAALSERLDEFSRAMGFDRILTADLKETMRYYYAQIEWGVDHQVGRILRALEEERLADNTVVAFTADHGDFMGTHRMVRKGPFLYDALLHVPLMWWAPGRIAKGHRSKALAQGIDIFPTLLDLTGGRPQELPGRSLKPFLQGEGEADIDRPIFTSCGYDELDSDSLAPSLVPKDKEDLPLHTQVLRKTAKATYKTSMLRSHEWKLILSETRSPELYRMNGGWVERENLAGKGELAGVRRKLEAQLTRWWRW